jgi:hypothetical protein
VDVVRDNEQPWATVEAAATEPTPCAGRWKAAQGDNKPGAYVRWEQTGVFSSVCRHGLVMTMADMRRSGEG